MWHWKEVVSRLTGPFFSTTRKHCRKRKQRSNVIKQSCAGNQIRLFVLFLSFLLSFSTTMMNAYNEPDWGVSTDGDVFSPSFDHRDSLGQFNPFQDYEVVMSFKTESNTLIPRIIRLLLLLPIQPLPYLLQLSLQQILTRQAFIWRFMWMILKNNQQLCKDPLLVIWLLQR